MKPEFQKNLAQLRPEDKVRVILSLRYKNLNPYLYLGIISSFAEEWEQNTNFKKFCEAHPCFGYLDLKTPARMHTNTILISILEFEYYEETKDESLLPLLKVLPTLPQEENIEDKMRAEVEAIGAYIQ